MRTLTHAAHAILFTMMVATIVLAPGTYAAYLIT